MSRSSRLAVLRVVVPYAALATLWIVASDSALLHLTSGPESLARWSTYKGIAFVAVTATLLAYLVRRELLAREGQQAALADGEARYPNLRRIEGQGAQDHRLNVKEMQSEATGSLTGEGHQTRREADQALAGVMKPNLVRALIQRGALR
jgi:hypothetical protein